MYWYDRYDPAPRRVPVRRVRAEKTTPEPVKMQVEQQGETSQPVEEAMADPLIQETSVDETVSRPEPDWQESALRLQAEMDNFRKRQERRAQEAIAVERKRLLSLMLPVVDNLGRALAHNQQSEETLHQGVELTQRELLRWLAQEGVNRLETVGQPFDPNWQEAVATMPGEHEPGTVITEVESGYRLGDKLLRPAKVVVAA